jgi:hypothetical protein
MDERDASAGNRLDIEGILNGLYESEINASISWLWDGGIDVKLGDALNGYRAEGKVGSFGAAAEWPRLPLMGMAGHSSNGGFCH